MTDLIEEIRDGHVLLSLLEVLLGKTLVSLVLDSLFSSSGTEYFFKSLYSFANKTFSPPIRCGRLRVYYPGFFLHQLLLIKLEEYLL